jgi:hypothetical protein
LRAFVMVCTPSHSPVAASAPASIAIIARSQFTGEIAISMKKRMSVSKQSLCFLNILTRGENRPDIGKNADGLGFLLC